MKRKLTSILALTAVMMVNLVCANAQKGIYIPQEWRNRTDSLIWKETDTDNKYTWSRSRSVETDNVIVFWDNKYGSTKPSDAPSDYRVDIDDLLAKAEEFYQLESSKLGFVDPDNSNISKYKVMVLLHHDTGWICYGGGYDFQVPALWLSPSTCKPVGSAVAHEVGHSFHYMCYAEDSNHGQNSSVQTGFHSSVGNGATIWETTANWQALQSYPNEIMTESYHHLIFNKTHNYAFTHEWHRYQAYMFLTYLCEYYDDIQTVANVWNYHETSVKDFNQVLMDYKGLSATDLYKLHFDFAMHAVTWDINACKNYGGDNYIGNFEYRCVDLGDSTYQVALASCPQASGFNVIPLKVPTAGTEVTADFTALVSGADLADGDPAEYVNGNSEYASSGLTAYNKVSSNASQRAFRLGFVCLMKDGTRQYFAKDTLYCTGSVEKTAQTGFTVPENVDRMWMVVSPTPKRYFQHKWDESISGDDMWPYRVKFTGTDLTSAATVYYKSNIDGRDIADVTLTYNVYMPGGITDYSTQAVTVNGKALAMVNTALQLSTSDIIGKLVSYSTSGPSAGKTMFYAAKSDGTLINSGSTANGYGHWFGTTGNVVSWGSTAYVFSEFQTSSFTFNIGQYPNNCKNGDTYTVAQAIRYKKSSTEDAKALFVFNVFFDSSKTGYELVSIDYDDPTTKIVQDVNGDGVVDDKDVLGIYDYMQSGQSPSTSTKEDVNRDGQADTQDVLEVYDYMKQ